MNQQTNIQISLTKEESLVLSSFINRISLQDYHNLFEHPAEQKVLWTIESKLEKILVEPFKSDYTTLLKDARNNVDDNY